MNEGYRGARVPGNAHWKNSCPPQKIRPSSKSMSVTAFAEPNMQSFLHAIRTIFGVLLDALTFITLCFHGVPSRPRICFCANNALGELPMPTNQRVGFDDDESIPPIEPSGGSA